MIAMIRCLVVLISLLLNGAVAIGQESSESMLSWSELPPLPDPLGVAGPFAGVHHDALIVAGGANFAQPVWESDKAWHDSIHVLIRDDTGYRWIDGGMLRRPIAYGAAVSTIGVAASVANRAALVGCEAGLRRRRTKQALALPKVHRLGLWRHTCSALALDGWG